MAMISAQARGWPQRAARGGLGKGPTTESCSPFSVLTFTLDSHLNSLSLGFLAQESRYYILSSLLQSCVHPPVHSGHPSSHCTHTENQLPLRSEASHGESLRTHLSPWSAHPSAEIKKSPGTEGGWAAADLACLHSLLLLNLRAAIAILISQIRKRTLL